MIPFLETLDGGETVVGSRPVAVPPPWRFLAPQGPVTEARLALKANEVSGAAGVSGAAAGRGFTPAQRSGLRYEAKVQNAISNLFPDYIPSPHVQFLDSAGWRTCIPDGLLSLREALFIFEIKNQHSPESWWQLEKLYRPVLQILYPSKRIFCLEVCRLFDPATPYPAEFTLITDIKAWIQGRPIESSGSSGEARDRFQGCSGDGAGPIIGRLGVWVWP